MVAVTTAGAVLWWVLLAVFFLVIVPLVLTLIRGILQAIVEIRNYAADILEHGVGIAGNLDPVPALLETKQLTAGLKAFVTKETP